MAVVLVKSGAITNRDASPSVHNNPIIERGMMRESAGFVSVTSGDSIGSIYPIATVPSNCRVSQLLLYADDLGTTTVADFGLYDTTANGGVVVDADLFASAVVLNAGALNGVDITHEAGVSGTSAINGVEKFLWQMLGLSADPCKSYDIAATLTAACDGTGTLALKVRYVL